MPPFTRSLMLERLLHWSWTRGGCGSMKGSLRLGVNGSSRNATGHGGRRGAKP